MAPSNTRSERIASRNGVSRRVGLIRLCYRARCGMREMTYGGLLVGSPKDFREVGSPGWARRKRSPVLQRGSAAHVLGSVLLAPVPSAPVANRIPLSRTILASLLGRAGLAVLLMHPVDPGRRRQTGR